MAKRAEARSRNVAEMREAFLAAIERPILAIEDEKELLEFDELMATTPPMRPISVPLSAQEIRDSVPESGFKQSRVKQSTNRNVNHRGKHFTLSLGATTLVFLTLLVLLLMPRVFNFSIFPSGFPLFGTAPYATIAVVVQSKMVQDTYLLTASPQISKPNLTTRMVPDRSVSSIAVASRTVASSGIKPIRGEQASGFVLFDNSSRTA